MDPPTAMETLDLAYALLSRCPYLARWEWKSEEAPLMPCDRVYEVDRRACPMHRLWMDDAVCIRLIMERRRVRAAGLRDRLCRPDPGPRAPEYSG